VSVAELRDALDTLVEPSCCSGKARVRETIALSLPDGDAGTVDDPIFVDWLNQHAEPAPYGQGHRHEDRSESPVCAAPDRAR
jgi:hypothetical protein